MKVTKLRHRNILQTPEILASSFPINPDQFTSFVELISEVWSEVREDDLAYRLAIPPGCHAGCVAVAVCSVYYYCLLTHSLGSAQLFNNNLHLPPLPTSPLPVWWLVTSPNIMTRHFCPESLRDSTTDLGQKYKDLIFSRSCTNLDWIHIYTVNNS